MLFFALATLAVCFACCFGDREEEGQESGDLHFVVIDNPSRGG